MPTYDVTAPDGKTYEITAPEGASQEDVLAYAQQMYGSAEEPKKQAGIGGSFKKGLEQLKSTGQTALESLTGSPEEAAMAAQRRQSAIESKYGEGASLDRIKKAYEEKGLLAAGKELAGQIPTAIAEQVPNIGASLAGAGAGAAAGSVIPGVGTVLGGIAGAFAPSFVQSYGGNIQRQAQAQQDKGLPLEINRASAAGVAIPQAALDVVGTFIPLGGKLASKALGPEIGQLLSRGSSEAAEKLAKESLLTSVAKGTAIGVAAEVPTEVTQQMLERAQAGLNVLDQDAMKEYGETAFAVSLLGPIGIVGRLSNKSEAGRNLALAQQKAQETGEPQQVPLQLTYDPSIPNSRGEETMVVFPDGRVAPSDPVAFAERFKTRPKDVVQPPVMQLPYDPNLPNTRGAETMIAYPSGAIAPSEEAAFQYRTGTQPRFPQGTTEAYASPEDKAKIESARWEEARANSPTMQKFFQHKEVVTKEQQARRQQAEEAFKNAEMQGGVYAPPAPVEPLRSPTQTVAIFDPVEGVKFYEGTPNKTGSGVNYLAEDGTKKTVMPTDKNAVINPNELDVYTLETQALEKDLPKLRKDYESASVEFNKANAAFKKFIQEHPLQSYYYSQFIQPGANPNIAVSSSKNKGMFINSKEKGYHPDDLADIAHKAGFLSDEEFNNPNDNGGVNAFMDKFAQAYEGIPVDTPYSADAKAKFQALDQAYMSRDEEIQKRKEYLAQLKSGIPTEEQVAPPEFVPNEPATPAGAVTPAEYAYQEPVNPSFRAEVATPYADKFLADQDKLIAGIRKSLDQMGLKDVSLKIADSLQRRVDGKMEDINGAYFDKMISLSLAGDNMTRTMTHEALHAMKDLGFFSAKDWSMLEAKAKSTWMAKYDIANPDKYGTQTPEIQLEEAIAHAFADMTTQPGAIKAIMAKAINTLKRIGNFLRGQGYKTADDIFAQAKAGEFKATKEATVSQPLAEIPSKEKLKSSLNNVDKEYADKIIKQFTQEKATVKEKFENLKTGFFDRMMTGVFDEFRAIRKYDEKSYMQARLSKSIDGALQGLLELGQVVNDGGALNNVKGTKGLMQILEPVGSEVDQYQIWKALNRDARMPEDKRSFSEDLVSDRDKLIKGDLNGKPRKEIYEKALKEENALNRSVLKVALDAGIIDQEGFDSFANDIYYIPFYKQMEGGDVQSVSAASKLTGQYFSKALKGGDKKTNDLMENVLMNWSHILSASMKNQAAVSTVKAAESMKAAERVKPMDGKYPSGSVKVMEDGKPVHYLLTDPDLVDAISTISYLGPKSIVLDVAKGFTNALRYGITLNPAYKVRNLVRDSIQSAAISPLGNNILDNVYQGLKMGTKDNPTFMSALVGGGIFEMGVAHEGNQAKLIKRLIDKGVNANQILDTPAKIKANLQGLLEKYNEVGNKFENANRLALYQKLIDSGKSHLEASFAARDLMDFSMQGQFRTVKILGSVVPFFNARLQGLYKLGKDGVTPTYRVLCNATTGDPVTDLNDRQKAQRFMTISSAVVLASVALYGMYKDDEDFQRREDWDRDNFWWFKVGDTQFRIPKPFEIGALGTIAERTYEQIADDSVEGKVFGQRMKSILADTFAMNPIPQMVKPVLDIYANKDSFTGAPIESGGMENLSKQERINNNTSGLAIALGGATEAATRLLTLNPEAEGISPIQVDYALKAYLGWLGATAAATADLAVEPFTEGTKVRKPVIDTVGLGFIKTEPQTQSKYMTQFYTNNARIQSAMADMRHYAELGDMEKVQQIYEDKGDDIMVAKMYDQTSKQLAALRKQSRMIEASKDMDPEDKRAEMNRLKILMSDMTRQVEEMRKSIKK